jgi:hypothetical protein
MMAAIQHQANKPSPQRRQQERVRPHPLVEAGNPPHSAGSHAKTHSTRLRHRMVTVAPCPSGRRTEIRHQTKITTAMLVGLPVSSEQPVPEEVNDREIAVRMQMMDEVKLLFASEPAEALQSRWFDVVFLVKIYMCVERRRTGKCHHEKHIVRQDEKQDTACEDGWDEEERRVVSLSAAIGSGRQMAPGIVRMMEIDVVAEEGSAKPSMP